MSNNFIHKGLPNDLLNGNKEGARRLKVSAVIEDGTTDSENLIKKEYVYLADGKIDYIDETNLNTSVVIRKTFVWNGDQLTSITPQIQ